tara:strand:+ start:93 stop:1319 length:1227 start_codon:yes stop_codon:yes gene_type:complete
MVRLWLFGGKGGVGKTTSACSTAIWLANSGLKTLIVSSDPAHSTSDSFEQELGSEPTKINGYENLWGIELDPENRIESILPKFSGAMSGGVSGPLQSMMGLQFSDISEQIEPMETSNLILPGLDEAIAFDHLLEYVENPHYDCILFDTAPTGHTLRFLALPEILEGSIDRLIKIYRMAGGIKAMLFGRKEEEAIRNELEKFQKRVLHVRRVLEDKEITGFTLVTIPEKMAVNETSRAAETLNKFGINVNGIIVNRITPELDHPFLISRRNVELKHISQLKEKMPEYPTIEIPLENSDIHGKNKLEKIGIMIHGPIKKFSEDVPVIELKGKINQSIRRGIIIQKNGEEITSIEFFLPASNKEELSLRSENGILFVGVNGKETSIEIDIDVENVRAEFVDDILILTIANK